MTFSERMKGLLDSGVAASKEFAIKAGEKAQDLGEKGFAASKELAFKAGAKAQDLGERGMLSLEIKQLEGQAQKLVARLGSEACRVFVDEGGTTLSADDPAVQSILAEIAQVRSLIEQKEGALEAKKTK